MLSSATLQGLFVPVITPFRPDGRLDLPSYRRYLGWLLNQPVHGVVLGGTTGESPTLTWEEVEQLVQETKNTMAQLNRPLPIVLGTGTNDTAASVRRTEQALAMGADAALVITPYYNRPAPAGLAAHYRAVGEVGLPLIAYNIPYRTGLDVSIETMLRLLELPAVIGLKDSSGGLRQLVGLTGRTEKAILCGEDVYFHAALCAGARGGILASSGILPSELAEVYELVRQGDPSQAKLRFDRLLPLIDLLYREPNPAPLKSALRNRGLIEASALRLPMTDVSPELEQALAAVFHS